MEKIYRNDSQEVKHLITLFPEMEVLFQEPEMIHFPLQDDYFLAMVEVISSQQLSGKVARVIIQRLYTLFSNEITPENIIDMEPDKMRSVGLSYRKIEYLKSLASHVLDKRVDFDIIDQLSNEEVIKMLVQIKGIGQWSAEMFMIFSLGREDVFSVLDLGLRYGLNKLYQKELSIPEMLEITAKWSPYRTLCSLYLWRLNERIKS